MTPPSDVTSLLAAWKNGDANALEQLLPLVYEELHGIARRHWRGQPDGYTLQPTALVNEAFLKMAGRGEKAFQNRAHFYAVASTAMRQVLLNHAQASLTAKRGGGQAKIPFEEESVVVQQAREVVALNEALTRFHEIDPRKCRVVELRYFGGLTIDEAAEVLQVSAKTVVRDWELARAWLLRELSGAAPLPVG